MLEPPQNTMSGGNPMNNTFQDSTTFEYLPTNTGIRSDFTESVSQAGDHLELTEMPVDVGIKREVGDSVSSTRAQGGATYDSASQMTAQSRWGSRRDSTAEEAKKLPGAGSPVAKGNPSAVEDLRQEVGFLESQLRTVAPQTRGF